MSSTELLHERAMARFYKAVALEEEQTKQKQLTRPRTSERNNIPKNPSQDEEPTAPPVRDSLVAKTPEIFIKTDSVEDREYKYNSRQTSHDSEASEHKWHMSFDEDYTASTVSTDGEYSEEEEGSLNGEIDRNNYTNEEDTYNPRDKIARPLPFNEDIEEEEEESEREILKPLPLLDPNFVPKPILKRRESDTKEPKLSPDKDVSKAENQETFEEKPKKEEKMTLFKKFTKMPVQKPFPFPKILNKKEPKKAKEDTKKLDLEMPIPAPIKKEEEKLDKISEEGRTVIDYYGNIVKEYGGQKRPTTPLYLKTEDLKAVAEKQQHERKDKEHQKKVVKSKKRIGNIVTANKLTVAYAETPNSINRPTKSKQSQKIDKSKLKSNHKRESQINDKQLNTNKKDIQQIVLKTTERATIIIPIDYKELEEKAKLNVRSAIDYMVDMCLLMLAFWVYLFKDERLAIPFLILIIYRQLQETLLMDIPEWFKNHTPSWLKKKTS